MTNQIMGIGDFVASFKGDVPGHEFHGNQYGGGGGSGSGESSENGNSESALRGQALPKPKIISGYEVHDSFANKKGTALYTLQKPTSGSENKWAIIKTMRRDKDKSAVHYNESMGKRDEVIKDFNNIKKYEG